MNIFAVNVSAVESAIALPDKLVVKMPLESAQMLSTALRIHAGDEWCALNGIYKTAYKNHPCTIWARKTKGNYLWLYKHYLALCNEYTRRYNKIHSCERLADAFMIGATYIPEGGLTEFAQAMPDVYKNPNHITAYRDYVINEKHYAQWNKTTPKPEWWHK